MSYEFTSRIRYSEVGPDGRLKLVSLVDYLQDCCVFHTDAIGFGPDVWAARQAVWVIVSWDIVINEYPKFSEPVTTKTWCYKLLGCEGKRNLTMKGADGRLLAYANSRWVFYDMNKHRPARIPEGEIEGFGVEEAMEMKKAPLHLRLPEVHTDKRPFKVRVTNLDTNHHVNNEQYILMAMGYLPLGFVVGELKVEYIRQAMLGDLIYPKVAHEGQNVIVSLDNAEGVPYAIAEFTEKEASVKSQNT